MQNKDSSARSSLLVQAVFTCTHKSRLLGETRLGQEIREQVTTTAVAPIHCNLVYAQQVKCLLAMYMTYFNFFFF